MLANCFKLATFTHANLLTQVFGACNAQACDWQGSSWLHHSAESGDTGAKDEAQGFLKTPYFFLLFFYAGLAGLLDCLWCSHPLNLTSFLRRRW